MLTTLAGHYQVNADYGAGWALSRRKTRQAAATAFHVTNAREAQKSLMASAKPMSANSEQVAHDVLDREESLGVCHRFEASHVTVPTRNPVRTD